MNARIARGSAQRTRPKGRAAPRSVNTRRSKTPGMLETMGVPPKMVRRIGGWLLALVVFGVLLGAVLMLRLPQLAGLTLGEAIGEAGFKMQRVEIHGTERVSRLDIYNVAFDQPSMAMPLVDLAATRARLLEFGWIREARVSRRLPDTLVVDIVERRPVAIWQNGGRLSLIDAEGVVLEPVRVEAMPQLPLVIGADANRHLASLAGLLSAAPHLRPQVAGATWVGGRRWDIRFQTGETLTLPEGNDLALRAIRRFASMDQQTQLLGRGFVRFDMRDPARMVVRVTREPGSSVPQLVPSDPGQIPEDLSRTI
ncbi:cell division protein FtsQ/DivIB [Sphingosinicella sp. LHD-64]|uniref:cell division protein FtsQ/DivIB n=1 Tax=Sphingosinicella sp. LHD-64 TaxID=3072139 RepID=UPI00280DDBCA|nr:cell division protein FtsQ/DivIB [Sphingosinicella sp. LHD-64]MDQ8758236.1 cell division protein FtsQ/DivIB [Sphingosinicella sp. LHD-64]